MVNGSPSWDSEQLYARVCKTFYGNWMAGWSDQIVAVMFMAFKRYIITRVYITIYKILMTLLLTSKYLIQKQTIQTTHDSQKSWWTQEIGSIQVAKLKLCYKLWTAVNQ